MPVASCFLKGKRVGEAFAFEEVDVGAHADQRSKVRRIGLGREQCEARAQREADHIDLGDTEAFAESSDYSADV